VECVGRVAGLGTEAEPAAVNLAIKVALFLLIRKMTSCNDEHSGNWRAWTNRKLQACHSFQRPAGPEFPFVIESLEYENT
jgi:hypothetical protein